MLEIQNVSKTFNAGTVNEKTALNGLNLKLNEGDFVTVIGGNGAGKSTMLNAVAGVWPVDCGKIIIDGVDVTRLSEHQRAAYIVRVNDKSLVFAFVSHPHTDYGSYIHTVYRVFGIGVVYKHFVRRNV